MNAAQDCFVKRSRTGRTTEIDSYGFNMAGGAREGEVRIEERLKLKIAEAKNLPQRTNGKEVCCVVSLDQEEIYRTSTATVEKALNPLFTQEFQFQNPRHFRHLCIYLVEKDKNQEKRLGKVAIRREQLKEYNYKDHWFPLIAVDANSEVQGQVHIEIQPQETYPKITSISPDYQQDASSPKVSHRSMESPVIEMTASNLSVDRKVSKSKKITEYCKFGSCSSTGSKKILSTVNIAENLTGLARSESLRSTGQNNVQQLSKQQGLHRTYGPSNSNSSSRNKQNISMNTENLRSEQSLNSFIPSGTYVHSGDYNPFSPVDQSPSEYYAPRMAIKVLECSELTARNGQCDPYASVTVIYSNNKQITKQTKVRKKTVNPTFDEVFLFDVVLNDSESSGKDRSSGGNNSYTISNCNEVVASEVCVSLWHDRPSGHSACFLGEVRKSLRTDSQSIHSNAWYCLRSRGGSQQSPHISAGTRFSSLAGPTALGTLRLNLLHTVDIVLPLSSYQNLKGLLLKEHKSIKTSAIYVLSEVVTNKAETAQPLVRLLTYEDKLVPNIMALAEAELAVVFDATTIFRGNTLVSKMMDEAMRLTGITYLQQTVKPVLDVIMAERKVCEIDPSRIKDPTTIESNLANLKEYVEKMFNAITASFVNCPAIMSRLFEVLRQCATKKFPQNPNVAYSVVSGFIFLRFFAPAILGPRLFDLTTEQIDPQTNRTLTLISKTIQSLGNLTSSQACKEEYMSPLYTSFSTENHIKAVKKFLDFVSRVERQNPNTPEVPIVIKEGTMMKKSQNRKRFRANLKKRHFKLTSCDLSYSKDPGKRPIRTIPLTEIILAEAVPDTPNLKMTNMFQIQSKDLILYIQASNSVEMKEWLSRLGKLCQGNNTPMSHNYHPGIYELSSWTCCESNKSDAVGCKVKEGVESPSSPPHPPNLLLQLDPARDLQRIHSLLCSYNVDIEKLAKTTISGCQVGDLTKEELHNYHETLTQLLSVTYSLEEEHRKYQRQAAKKTEYGSKQTPIGDDNYLNLGARPSTMSLDNQQMGHMGSRSHKMLHSATAPSLHSAISPPSNRYFMPYSSPSFMHKSEVKPNLQLSITPQKDFPMSHSRDLNLQISTKNSLLQDKIFGSPDSTFLTNSIYNSSSTESMRDGETKANSRLSSSSTSGYLKMSSLTRPEDCGGDITNIRISPTQELIRKDRISPPVPEQKPQSISEYVEVRPKVPERDTKPIPNPVIPPKTINKAKVITPDQQTEYPQYACAEYELMSNFSSAFKDGLSIDDSKTANDTPPAIPPRSHYSTPKKIPTKTIPKYPLDRGGTDEVLQKEFKSFEQYQSKGETCSDNSRKRVTQLRIVEDGDDFVDEQKQLKRKEDRSQNICDSNAKIETSDIDYLRLDSQCNVSNIVVDQQCNKWTLNQDNSENISCSNAEQFQQSGAKSKHTCDNVDAQSQTQYNQATMIKKQKSKEESTGFFSRKHAQRKSIPKSKKMSTNNESSSLSAPPQRSAESTATTESFAERFTPSFFKKKTKVTDNVRLPPIC